MRLLGIAHRLRPLPRQVSSMGRHHHGSVSVGHPCRPAGVPQDGDVESR